MAQVADVGRAGDFPAEHERIAAEQPRRSLLHNVGQLAALAQRQIAGNALKLGTCADNLRRTGNRTAHCLLALGDGVDARAAHIGVDAHLVRDGIYHVAALGNNRVDSDSVLVAEGFAVGMYADNRKRRRIQGVYAVVWGAAVGGFAAEGDAGGVKTEVVAAHI